MPAGALAGLCPACLLAQGADTETGGEGGGGGNGPGSPGRFEPPPAETIARLFPQLEILGLLGAGGMGAVYKARQPALDRLVALKILPPADSGAASGAVNFAERFNREARALARLSHPSIVAVHEFGQVEGLHFFIMEFVDGANLRQLEQAGRLSPREALQIIPQICDALQYAHDEGVVHRDIKPENVLVDRRGRVKIADFGLAKILGADPNLARLTAENQVMGTPHYMAPEQVERPLTVDHRADIYALGVVFYEMLTGDLPLGKFPPPSRKVQVDVRLDEVVLRALENDPARRYQQASEVKSRVETIVASPAPMSPPLSPAAAAPDRGFLHWADFPVAVERDGRRAVHWQGAFLAFAVIFGFLTLGFAFVSAITGRSLFGWVGIVGWPSLIPRALLAGMLVAWGVRCALLRPPAAGLPHTPQGTVILAPRRLWWRNPRLLGPLMLLLVFTYMLFQERWLGSALRKFLPGANRKAAQIAARDPQTGRLVARLPGRGTVELLAIGEPDAAPNGWWLPDGTPITNATFDVRGAAEMAGEGRALKELLFRASDLPTDASRYGAETEPGAGHAGGGEVLRDGRRLAGAWQMRFAWPARRRLGTVRLAFGLDPWRTIATEGIASQSSKQTRLPTDPRWVVNFQHPPYGATGQAQVSVLFGPPSREWTHRVIAVDTNGLEHTYNSAQGTPLEGQTLWTYHWNDVAMPTVKEFRLQVQPLHWVEFPDVALQPRRPVPGPVAPAFGPVRELAFELIDFDTGRMADFPPGQTDGNALTGAGENIQWLQEHGFDAAAGTDALHPVGMDFVALENADWDNLTAGAALKRFYRGSIYRPRQLTPPQGKLPATFAFRTREQGVGLLQLVAFDPQRPGATVRFKLITRPQSEPE